MIPILIIVKCFSPIQLSGNTHTSSIHIYTTIWIYLSQRMQLGIPLMLFTNIIKNILFYGSRVDSSDICGSLFCVLIICKWFIIVECTGNWYGMVDDIMIDTRLIYVICHCSKVHKLKPVAMTNKLIAYSSVMDYTSYLS